jgi:hypothetical protein
MTLRRTSGSRSGQPTALIGAQAKATALGGLGGRQPEFPPLPEYPGKPSKPDWKALGDLNNALFANGEPPIPGYIYDKERWYRMDPNIPGQQPKDHSINGKRSACR